MVCMQEELVALDVVLVDDVETEVELLGVPGIEKVYRAPATIATAINPTTTVVATAEETARAGFR